VHRKCSILLLTLLFIIFLTSDIGEKGPGLAADGRKTALLHTEENTGTHEMTSSPAPRVPKSLDFGKLYGLNSDRIGWGVQLKGRGKAPEVSHVTVKLFEKYNAHYIGDTSKKKVYFVFSASYEGGYTPRILDALKANDVQAVFFLVGEYIKENPELVKRMIHEGHEIGNHSMHHPSLPDVSDERLKKEMVGMDDYFYSNFGKQMKYFMPPSGEYSEKVLAAAKQMGYTSIFWSFAYLDYDENSQKGAEYAYEKVMANLHNGAIIFLHTVSKDNAYALDSILKAVKKEGYTIGTMDL
jgi:peptidoglycan-N-acetylmuramic acid deacetylase